MLRDFTKTDWYGFAGAEVLPSGEQPKIGQVDGWTIIVSGNVGDCDTSVELTSDDGDTIYVRRFEWEHKAVAFAKWCLSGDVDVKEMLPLFRKIC
jgi:hypothetical protein